MAEAFSKTAVTAAALAMIGSAAPAEAATVVDLPLSEILTNGQTYEGSFDISSLLDDGSNAFKVTSATLQLNGSSDYGQTGTVVTGYWSYSYSCGGWWSWSTCYASGAYYAGFDGTQDGLQLSAGGESAWGYDAATGSPASYYGSLVAQLLLGEAGLVQANATGSLVFTALASTNTNVRLNGASLSLELEALPPQTGAVPEPATWAMMLIGFGAVGAAMRRTRRRSSRVAIA